MRSTPSPQCAATSSASEMPSWAARSRSRIFGLSARAMPDLVRRGFYALVHVECTYLLRMSLPWRVIFSR